MFHVANRILYIITKYMFRNLVTLTNLLPDVFMIYNVKEGWGLGNQETKWYNQEERMYKVGIWT